MSKPRDLVYINPNLAADRITVQWLARHEKAPEVFEEVFNIMDEWMRDRPEATEASPFASVVSELLQLNFNQMKEEEKTHDE